MQNNQLQKIADGPAIINDEFSVFEIAKTMHFCTRSLALVNCLVSNQD
jgi:hypothetical protein